jgi:alanyl-tRNA synthetase
VADEKQEVVEIWNDVFMQYLKKDGVVVGELQNKNVDTGSGLERVTAVLAGVDNVFATDLFTHIMAVARTLATSEKSQRVISDHMRTAVFMIADGVLPSNTDQGYVLRRLLRRAVVHTDAKKIERETLVRMVSAVVETYADIYPALSLKQPHIQETITTEHDKFLKTLSAGLKEFEKIATKSQGMISGADAFLLFSSYGFPIELVKELSAVRQVSVDEESFKQEFASHQALSKAGAEQKFKGGLADHSDVVVRYHTATHLLHQALIDVLGPHVAQKGSNITSERMRFDFTHHTKMTEEEIRKVEAIVNDKIQQGLPVHKVVLTKDEAVASGAKHMFDEKYPDMVSVYYIGETLETAYSKEFCGGPHVENIKELGVFRITKEEAVASGIRRIKAVLSTPVVV